MACDEITVKEDWVGKLSEQHPAGRPYIITLCGSTKFMKTYQLEMARLTLAGYIVIGVGMASHGMKLNPSEVQKQRLDHVHLHKIDLADIVYFLDVGGYMGDSSRSELKYAQDQQKKIWKLSELFPNYCEPWDVGEAMTLIIEEDARING